MGLTFIAAGVSVPDALSGIAVIKEGHGKQKRIDKQYISALYWMLSGFCLEMHPYIDFSAKGVVMGVASEPTPEAEKSRFEKIHPSEILGGKFFSYFKRVSTAIHEI